MDKKHSTPVNFQLPNPDSLLLLATIADCGSLTAAARERRTTQPALSKQLKRLENQLGVPLFERSLRGVTPNAYGQALLPRARAIQNQVMQAAQEVAQLRGSLEGHVVIALSHFATLALLPLVITPFRNRWPDVQISIMPPTFQLGSLREGKPHFAVVSLPVERLGSEFTTRPIYSTNLVVVTRKGHPLAEATQLSQLVDSQWVLPSMESSMALGLARAFKRKKLPAPICKVTSETLTGFETLVLNTDLIGAMPLEVFRARSISNGLTLVPINPVIEGPHVAIVRWSDAHPTPAAEELEEIFVHVAHQLAKRPP
ncbi:MAG: LysR family transcriptional regulator [Limnohabitans sp.]|nr:LysR family transcriptional regulator [Limnohabitans sp.]